MILDILLSYLVIIPAGILCILPMMEHIKRGHRRFFVRTGFVLIVSVLFLSFMDYAFHAEANSYLLLILFLLFMVYHLSLNVHISQSLAIFCSAVALLSILSNLAECLSVLCEPVWALAGQNRGHSLIQIALSILAVALLARPYARRGCMLINNMTTPRVWYTTIFVSGAFFAINMLLLQLEPDTVGQRSKVLFTLLLLALLILWLLLQALFIFIVLGIIDQQSARERLQILEMQESQFAAQQRYIKATERVRHDFRQSVMTLSELYEAGNYEALGSYLKQYVKSIPPSEVTMFCENTALNALLNFYVHIAEQNQIRFTIQVNLDNRQPVTDVDLCNMVGNILVNAVIACQRTEHRFIQLSILTEENVNLYIVAVNSFDGKVRKKGEKYLPVNREGSGLGLASISSTAEKYGGTAQFSHDNNRFYSNIAIPLT
ncbi:MAG: sensor histidine kinase [Firmicutes bacterium]|nr:sensor histidine kinase [Bacillota bacterium]